MQRQAVIGGTTASFFLTYCLKVILKYNYYYLCYSYDNAIGVIVFI